MNDRDARHALSLCLFRAGAAHPFLREPIDRMELIPDPAAGLATDGVHIFYAPDAAPDRAAVEHMLMHCLFRHLLIPEKAVTAIWDLACDLSAEFLRAEFFPSREGRLNRLLIVDALGEEVDPRVAGAVYRALMDRFEDELDLLYARYRRDDHRYWTAPPLNRLFEDIPAPRGGMPGEAPCEGCPRWDGDDGSSYEEWKRETLEGFWPSEDGLPGGVALTGRHGLAPGCREEKMLLRQQGKHDFSRYLRRFSITREEIRLDMGSFDYIPYYYGLERYGNMPLVEPLEYAESHRVEQLVIAIDTSASCSRPVVERFLAEIQRILMGHEYFFKRMDVHIIQCDAIVQSDVVIHSTEEWKSYTKDIVIKGRSGTDFRPVFALVEKLRQAGELKNLKGLMYFTDGDGVYPQRQTPYETAFVFSDRRALEYSYPDWIIPLCLDRAI